MDQNQQKQKNIDWSRGGFPTWAKMLVAVAVVLLLMLVLFRVRNFEVEGNIRYTPEEIFEASGLGEGDILMGVNKTSTASRLLVKLPYLKQVTIEKALPGTIRFTVEECTAQGMAMTDYGTYWVINREGKLLEEVDGPQEGERPAYPLITGVHLALPFAGELAEFDQDGLGNLALELLNQVEAAGLASRISEINLEDPTAVYLIYDDRLEVRLGDGYDGAYKLAYLKAVVGEIGETQKGALDLSFSTGETAIFHPAA